MDITQIFLNVDIQTYSLVTFMLIGGTKFFDELFPTDFKRKGAAKIAFTTLLGIGLGFGIDGLTILTAAAMGLGASGLVTGLSFIGKKSSTVAAASVQGPAVVTEAPQG